MRTIIGLLIFAALLWVALNWSLFSILFMSLMLVIAIAVVRMSHHVSPIDFYRIGFAIRTSALHVIGWLLGIIRFFLGWMLLAGVLWVVGWGIGEIKEWVTKPAAETRTSTASSEGWGPVTVVHTPEQQNHIERLFHSYGMDVNDPFDRISMHYAVFDECMRLHKDVRGIHSCMLANGYEDVGGSCKTLSADCYLTGPKRIKQ
jgi:hypothetical protein